MKVRPPDGKVHFSNWASQPDVHIYCDGTWTTPVFASLTKEQEVLQERGIYFSDDERYYTFEPKHVTCLFCIQKGLKAA